MSKTRCLSIVLSVISLSACSGGTGLPTAPSAASPTSPFVTSSRLDGGSRGTLTISTFTVTRSAIQPYRDWVYYDVKLRLTETTGKSGVALREVGLNVPHVGVDYGCTRTTPVRINPGETWDLDSLGYCAPEVAIHKSVGTDISRVTLSVLFVNDDGSSDSLDASTDTK